MRRFCGALMLVTFATLGVVAAPLGVLKGSAEGRDSDHPTTRPITAEELAAVYGPSTDADAANVRKLVDEWATVPVENRSSADCALQRNIPQRAFVLFETETDRADLPPGAREWLHSIVEREIPRRRARFATQQRTNIYNDWNGRTAVEAYEKFGSKNAKWDDAARAGIAEFVSKKANHYKAYSLLNKAIAQGCDDAMVKYMDGREMESFGDPDGADQRLHAAADAILKTDYPASRKVLAVLYATEEATRLWTGRYAQTNSWPPRFVKDYSDLLNAAVNQWPSMVNEPGIPEKTIFETAQRIVNLNWHDREGRFHSIYPALEKAMPNSAAPLIIKGEFYILSAWDARGGGWANTVTPEGWKLFAERLDEAQKALEEAYRTDPSWPGSASHMITVCLGKQLPRQTMELWFGRAVAANPDDMVAYQAKLTYLEPKWGGSYPAMMQFVHECIDQGNWFGNVPFIILDAQHEIAVMAKDPSAYWQMPEVWQDLQAVYVPCLRAIPHDDKLRSSYCYWACKTAHWDEANKQFDLLGDKADPGRFAGQATLTEMRSQARAHAGK